MSKPKKPQKVKLFSSLIMSDDARHGHAIEKLTEHFGPLDYYSEIIPFDKTDYYNAEMGKRLTRMFLSFKNLVQRDALPEIKLFTNGIEEVLSRAAGRSFNIDPGFVTLENVVLATCKNFSHRIYLREGIFAEITLIFEGNSYRPLKWTFPDYSTPEIIDILLKIRDKYKGYLRTGS